MFVCFMYTYIHEQCTSSVGNIIDELKQNKTDLLQRRLNMREWKKHEKQWGGHNRLIGDFEYQKLGNKNKKELPTKQDLKTKH